jgi:signal transduction histidine kinase
VWYIAGGFVLGAGVWSVHFLGMMAWDMGVPTYLDGQVTALSMLPAFIGAILSTFCFVQTWPYRLNEFSAMLIAAMGLGGSHAYGMRGMYGDFVMRTDPGSMVISAVVGLMCFIVFGVFKGIEFRLGIQQTTFRNLIVACLISLAFAGAHYLGVWSVVIIEVDPTGTLPKGISHTLVTWLTVLTTLTISGFLLLSLYLNKRFRLAAENLNVSQNRLVEAIESHTDGFVLFDRQLHLTLKNSAFVETFPTLRQMLDKGLAFDDICRTLLADFIVPKSETGDEMTIEHLAFRPETAEGLELKFRDGRWFYYRATRTGTGDYVTVWTDITRQKQMQGELRELNVQKDTFISILGHDLRSPFNAMLGFSGILASNADKLEAHKVKEYAHDINEAAEQTFKLLENLLDWAHLQLEETKVEPQLFSLSKVIEENRNLFGPVAKAKGVQLAADAPADIKAFGDDQLSGTIIRNFVNNAVKYCSAGDKVILKAFASNNTTGVEVIDTGIGMSPDRLESLFRLDRKASRAGTGGETGTGLGLHICKDMAEMQNGQIDVESKEGEGSTFRLTLPAHDK